MNRLLSLPLLLIATASFAEPAPLDTAAMDAKLTASLEAKVADKVDHLNNIGFGEVTIVDVTVESAGLYQDSYHSWSADQKTASTNPFL